MDTRPCLGWTGAYVGIILRPHMGPMSLLLTRNIDRCTYASRKPSRAAAATEASVGAVARKFRPAHQQQEQQQQEEEE